MPPRDAAIDHIDYQTDRHDQIEAAIKWIQTREALFKRIAAWQAKTDLLRVRKNVVRKNGKIEAPRVERARALTAPRRNR
jgi:hypothetical protein